MSSVPSGRLAPMTTPSEASGAHGIDIDHHRFLVCRVEDEGAA